MQLIRYDLEFNYGIPETEGPTFEEINIIM